MSKFILAVGLGLIATSPAAAQSPARSEAVKIAADKSDVNKIVCQREEEIGSRLKSKKVCMSVEQWAAYRAQHREDVERMQEHANTARSN